MTDTTSGYIKRGAVILALAVALAGCGGAKPTPKVIHVTPSPAPSVTAAPSDTPAPTETPAASGSAEASPTASPSPSPSPAPAGTPGTGTVCTGAAENPTYFSGAAAELSFDVYCAVLPSTWWLQDTQFKGAQMTIIYKNNSGGYITVGEGNFCSGAPLCWTSTSDLGAASFGPLSGSLKLRDSTPTYAVYVDAGTTHGYQITGKGMSQATFVAYAAAMTKVPKA